jgi:hypothetical protein
MLILLTLIDMWRRRNILPPPPQPAATARATATATAVI